MGDTWIPDMQVWGEEREEALADFQAQIDAWALKMPDVEPLVTQFGLHDFRNTGLIEYWIVNDAEAGYCGKFLFVFDGQTCPAHRHERKHETFFVVRGKVVMVLNDEERAMVEGDTLVMPPGTRHSFTGDGDALLLEVSMPSTLDDNFFDDRRIGRDGTI
jgi:mannose-6-phosphate isomerase-like protein (cupin superfamily)